MDRVCPLLGLSVDRRSVVDGVDAAHRCHAELPPAPLEHRIQAQRCLTPAHERCDRLLAYRARGGVLPGATLADGLVSTRLVLAPEPPWRGIAGRARRAPRVPLVAAAAATVAVAATGVAVGAAVLDGRLDLALPPAGAASSPSLSASGSAAPPSPSLRSVGATASPEPSLAASELASPSASSVPTPVPTLAATPVPTPVASLVPATPAPEPATYTVREGDTLAAIAQQFGTTVAALQELNGIDDPDEIVVGQVLNLP